MRTAQTETATNVLDVAERLVQQRGFNGFSYADVARELGITTAALHYHFRSKAELGEALIARYAERFNAALAALDASAASPQAELASYAELYAGVLGDHRMCLCGMLAADYGTLPEPMRERVVRFFDDNEAWLARVLERGRADGSLRFAGSPKTAARTLLSSLEGAMLVARPYDDLKRFRASAAFLIDGLVERA
jgi:TetR/AcrR family transcriptional repressor of nem operon